MSCSLTFVSFSHHIEAELDIPACQTLGTSSLSKCKMGFGTGGMSAESMWECSLSLDNLVDLNMFLPFNRYVEGLVGRKRYLSD